MEIPAFVKKLTSGSSQDPLSNLKEKRDELADQLASAREERKAKARDASEETNIEKAAAALREVDDLKYKEKALEERLSSIDESLPILEGQFHKKKADELGDLAEKACQKSAETIEKKYLKIASDIIELAELEEACSLLVDNFQTYNSHVGGARRKILKPLARLALPGKRWAPLRRAIIPDLKTDANLYANGQTAGNSSQPDLQKKARAWAVGFLKDQGLYFEHPGLPDMGPSLQRRAELKRTAREQWNSDHNLQNEYGGDFGRYFETYLENIL